MSDRFDAKHYILKDHDFMVDVNGFGWYKKMAIVNHDAQTWDMCMAHDHHGKEETLLDAILDYAEQAKGDRSSIIESTIYRHKDLLLKIIKEKGVQHEMEKRQNNSD